MSRTYLESIRSTSCYPAFRGFVQIFTILGYLVAALLAVGGVMTGQGTMFLAIAGAALIALMIKVAKEASLMLADIADATIDSASKIPSPVAPSNSSDSHETFPAVAPQKHTKDLPDSRFHHYR